VGTSEVPAHSGDRTNWNGQVQFHHSAYFGFGVLSESGAALRASRSYITPFAALPSGSVLISSDFPDGSDASRTVQFGGNTSQNTSTFNRSADFTNALSWFSTDNKHRVKLTSEVRRDDYTLDQTPNTLGSFYYTSLADLAAGVPALYTRTLRENIPRGGQYLEGVAIVDSYKADSGLQIQYGLRLDGNQFANRAVSNVLLQQLYGVTNSLTPDHVFVSPRIGLSYAYGKAPQVEGFDGAFRGPRAVVRGGIGMFQSNSPTTLLAAAMANTGLASAMQQVTCVGPAAPIPDWQHYESDPGSTPAQCATAASSASFASTAPNVVTVAKDYAAPKSLRGNLQWSGFILDNLFNASFTATYSFNLDQPESVDLNFDSTPQFMLTNEASRPVYVATTSIDPATGTIAAGDGRVSPLFNRVTQLRTDLTSEARQFQVQLGPTTFNTKWSWNIAYTYQQVRAQTSGFTSTVGNPLRPEWARGNSDWRHQIQSSMLCACLGLGVFSRGFRSRQLFKVT
jgi:hypothetical protein